MDWKRVMFTDEACFHVGETAKQRVIRRAGTEYDPKDLCVKVPPWEGGACLGSYPLRHQAPSYPDSSLRQHARLRGSDSRRRRSTQRSMQLLLGPLQAYVNQARTRGVRRT